ncbi:serine/threonine-protein kinase STY8-like [Rosa rugosa]|uniref:serine/threonine-protein kinase STY8-like n=1 Tax=Rosa rugosa TaxID=74645 RepID=UPI002B417C9F|nr:serine/threonine-protein kinase STY8-like [Rosa rugosa]
MRLCIPQICLRTFLHNDAKIHRTLEASLIQRKLSSIVLRFSLVSPSFFFSLQSPSIALVQIIAGDPECVSETWMSNVYSLGMVIWEMVTGEAAYSACSPIQVAVGIVACGLRPEILKDCPQMLRSLMTKCWNNSPSKRPQFSEILSLLLRTRNNVR